MKTAEAAIGHWPTIFEHFGLPPITGKNHFKGECPVCEHAASYVLMTATVGERGFVPAATVTV